jgi:hypothetical protein
MNKNNLQEQKPAENSAPLIEGIDFYFENGFMVLTARFLKKRGYCCGNGCRHCPYVKAENKS